MHIPHTELVPPRTSKQEQILQHNNDIKLETLLEVDEIAHASDAGGGQA